MKYEETPVKNSKHIDTNKLTLNELKNVSTFAVLWYLIKRHKFALTATYAIGLTVLYVFPPLPDLIKSLF